MEYSDWLEIYDFVMMPFRCAYCDQREEGYDARTLEKFRQFMREQSPMNANTDAPDK
jgi:hypothetical protein